MELELEATRPNVAIRNDRHLLKGMIKNRMEQMDIIRFQ